VCEIPYLTGPDRIPVNGRAVPLGRSFKRETNYDVIFIGELLCSIRQKDAMVYYFRNVGNICCTNGKKIPMGGFVEMEVPLILGKIIPVVCAKLISRKRTVYNSL